LRVKKLRGAIIHIRYPLVNCCDAGLPTTS
jgi:hypothetical protein